MRLLSEPSGRAVFITGGGSGIGAAMTESFHRQGARVAFVDIAVEPSKALVQRLGPEPPLFISWGLRDIEALRWAIQESASRLGPLRVLINKAGNDDRHAAVTVTPECWDDRMAVNLRHQFFATQAVFPLMVEAGGGSIVNLSSTAWTMGEAGYVAYTTAKPGIGLACPRVRPEERAGQRNPARLGDDPAAAG